MTAGPLTQVEIDRFYDDGYLVLPQVISREEAAGYGRAVLDLLPRDLTVPDPWLAHAGRIKPYRYLADGRRDDCIDTPELLPLYGNRRLYEVAAQLLGSPHIRIFDGSVGITVRNMSEKASPRSQNLHVDATVPDDVDDFLCTPQELQVGGCLYLTDVSADGGGIHIVPGAHKQVAEAAGEAKGGGRHLNNNWHNIPDMPSVEVTGNAGDFAMLHHLMPHAASHNRLPQARLAVFLRYIRTDHPYLARYLPPRTYNPAQLAVINPLARRLLGLDPWD